MSTAERTIVDIESLLNGPLTAPTKKIEKFDYISWNDSVRVLNHIFGPLGWEDEMVSLSRTEFGYTCTIRLTLHLPNGETRIHTGVGYGTVRTWSNKGELSLEMKARAEDQGVKSAFSDALSRACKRWKALGLDLYGGDDLSIGESEPEEKPKTKATSDTKQQLQKSAKGSAWEAAHPEPQQPTESPEEEKARLTYEIEKICDTWKISRKTLTNWRLAQNINPTLDGLRQIRQLLGTQLTIDRLIKHQQEQQVTA